MVVSCMVFIFTKTKGDCCRYHWWNKLPSLDLFYLKLVLWITIGGKPSKEHYDLIYWINRGIGLPGTCI